MKWYLPSTLAESSPCRSPAITMGSFPRWLAAITQPLQPTSGNTNSLCGAHMLREPEDDKNKKNHAAFRQLLETAFSIFSIKATYKKKKKKSKQLSITKNQFRRSTFQKQQQQQQKVTCISQFLQRPPPSSMQASFKTLAKNVSSVERA